MTIDEKKTKRRLQTKLAAEKWRKNNPDKAKNAYLRYQYGLTLAEWNTLFLSQNGVCAICHKTEIVNGRNLCVDHNHVTGKVRGLLCLDCNSGIGHLKDNKEYLASAIAYLDKYDSTQ